MLIAARGGFFRRTLSSLHNPSQTVIYLRDDRRGIEAYVVGTAHVSKQSAMEVKRVIESVKPTHIMVELCQERATKLLNDPDFDESSHSHSDQLVHWIKQSPFTQPLAEMLKRFIKGQYSHLKNFGLVPGLEFKVAMEEAKRIHAKVILGDRNQRETLNRLVTEGNLFQVISNLALNPSPPNFPKIDFSNLEASIEAMKTRENARELKSFMEKIAGRRFMDVLVDERDQILTKSMKDCPSGSRVVGVVGLAHLDGIEKYWRELR